VLPDSIVIPHGEKRHDIITSDDVACSHRWSSGCGSDLGMNKSKASNHCGSPLGICVFNGGRAQWAGHASPSIFHMLEHIP
jgi:hypothetical protein